MKRRHLHEAKPMISAKNIRRWLVRLVVLGLGGAAVVMAKPDLVPDPQKQAQIKQVREQVLQANTEVQGKALQILGDSATTTQEVVGRVREVTYQVTNQDPQEIVSEVVTNITNEIKDLPQEQVKKIKVEICQEILKDVDSSR